MQRALFLDRDGVINIDHGYVYKQKDFQFVDGIFDVVRTAKDAGFLVVVVTNQSGIGRGYYTEAQFLELMEWVNASFHVHGGALDAVYFCPFHPEEGIGEFKKESSFRKPAPGMLLQAAKEHKIDLAASVMIGDSSKDMEAAQAAGVGRIFFLGGKGPHAVASLQEIIPQLS